MIKRIGVAGAGTMGSSIALSAALAGLPVVLFDTNDAILARASAAINSNLTFLTEKNKISPEEKEAAFDNIAFTEHPEKCQGDVIIEAIIESIPAKIALFNQLNKVNRPDCIFASNTSSLSISEIQAGIDQPQRVAGMHFFNPAHVMKLVEVIKGKQTSEATTNAIIGLCQLLKKTPVLCIDSPGFIVNRVARPYYLEAMKLVEQGLATFEDVDAVMEASGFKMGPFRLMDLIGIDINFAVSTSLYNALDKPARLQPSTLQSDKIEKGELGKKTGKGFYNYAG
jgi:3-hydroxybutyryl-CoA dehydrogenase